MAKSWQKAWKRGEEGCGRVRQEMRLVVVGGGGGGGGFCAAGPSKKCVSTLEGQNECLTRLPHRRWLRVVSVRQSSLSLSQQSWDRISQSQSNQ